LLSGEVVSNTADSAGAVFELAEVLQTEGPKVQDLAPLVGQLDTLLDALNSPLAEIVEKSVPFVPIATGLLKFYLEQSKQPLTLEKCVAIVSQSAYLESFKKFLADDAVLEQIGKTPASDALKGKAKELSGLEISEEEARRTVTKFPACKLAKQFGDVLKARLEQAGLEETAAQILVERVAWQTPRYMNQVWAASTEAVKHLGQPSFDAWRQEQEKYQSIIDYLVEKIETGPQKSVFNEDNLTFCDIYVPLEVQLLDAKGESLTEISLRDLEGWVTESLLQSNSSRILFIQGEAGRGKSVFCRMFADWVREKLFPAYVPILIPLRNLKALETTLTDTLASALENYDFVSSDTGWLTDENTRFLFLLDGFDELLLEGRESGGLKEFLPQVVQFQRNCHHRFLITGRPLSLQGIERVITQAKDDLQRAELRPMSELLQALWYQQWANKFGEAETERLKQFLAACPEDVQYGLAREPLLLYLLGRMHREGRLKAEMFEGTEGTAAKVVIYDEAVRWVIEEQRQNENFRHVGLKPEDLRQALTEAAVCVMQSGNEVTKISVLEARLQQDSNNPVYELLQQARQEVQVAEDKLLNNLLTAFYIKPASGDKEGSVEFAHKSFGEFLFAERLKNALEDWSQKGSGRRSQYLVPTEVMHWEIYDLLGYGGLTVEVVDYLRVLLTQHSTFDPALLFERLHDFYLRWWEGEFINAVSENWPQKKMLALRECFTSHESYLGLKQIDALTGFNIMILLFEMQRYYHQLSEANKKLSFNPCGVPGSDEFDQDRLHRIIGYGGCISLFGFRNTVYRFLSKANFKGAFLASVNLASGNLEKASFVDCYLTNSYLSYAILRSAVFTGADLSESIFAFADLRYASLNKAILNDVNFSHADLRGVNFGDSELCGVNLYDIKWDSQTLWANASGLDEVRNLPADLLKDTRFVASLTLSEGIDFAKNGNIKQALTTYKKAQNLDKAIQISASSWRTLCWNGCLHGSAAEVIFAGENSVDLEPSNGHCRDALALAEALSDKAQIAIANFKLVLEGNDLSDGEKEQRSAWVKALEAGENPFTPGVLAELKEGTLSL
jgi:uncharacterized protein YjbI with pentapeptide repeats